MRFTIICLLIFLSSVLSFAQTSTITPQQMREDLTYLNKYLKKWHPTYYAYMPKAQMNAFYDSLKNNCTNTMSNIDFLRMIRQAVGVVGCGHMNVGGFKNNNIISPKFFPLDIKILNNRLFAIQQDSLLDNGSEILSINGDNPSNLIEEAMGLTVSDGFNKTHKVRMVEYNFDVFLYMLRGKKDSFDVKFKNRMGEIANINIKAQALKVDSTAKKIAQDSSNRVKIGGNIALYKTDFDSATMVLDIDKFSGKKQGRAINSIFAYLHKHKTQNLIIDLRGNGGGSIFKGNKLLNYLLDEPIRAFTFNRKPNLTFLNPHFKARFFERITPILFMMNPLQYPSKHGWNHVFPFFKKQKNHFNGKIYIFTDGGTFSMSSFVTSHLKHRKQAVIIGEETGGSEYGSRGMSGGRIQLPNSKVKVALNVYNLTHSLHIEDKGHGIMPDYPINYTIDDVLNRKDLEMEKAKALILNTLSSNKF